MLRAALFVTALLGLVLGLRSSAAGQGASSWLADQLARLRPVDSNTRAFLELIGQLEANGEYNVIAGGQHFTDYAEHPYVLEPNRTKPLGTTAAGKYQMVRRTWAFARDALELPDFSPESQDRAAAWLLEFKQPGTNNIAPGGTGLIELVRAGSFDQALEAYTPEWEALGKVRAGTYPITLAQARELYQDQGGTINA